MLLFFAFFIKFLWESFLRDMMKDLIYLNLKIMKLFQDKLTDFHKIIQMINSYRIFIPISIIIEKSIILLKFSL